VEFGAIGSGYVKSGPCGAYKRNIGRNTTVAQDKLSTSVYLYKVPPRVSKQIKLMSRMQSPTQFHAIAVTYAFLRSQGFHRTCQQLLVDTLPLTKDVRVLPAHAAQASSLDQIISEYGRLK